MSIPELSDDLLINILQRVSKKCWWFLGPILRGGPRLRDIIYLPDVLKVANIYSMCNDPDNIHVKGRDPSDMECEGRYRPFFQNCLDAGNPTAIYYEGLRLATQEDDIKGAINLLHRNVPIHAPATLAAAILSICDGNGEMGRMYLKIFSEFHYPLGSEDARDMGEELIQELSAYAPTRNKRYRLYFDFPDCPLIPIPKCPMECFLRFGSVYNVCNDCHLWWCARRVFQML